ncbi:MAG: LysM peptidoglycan-binding domain-containing protein [Okeania sp. SIO3I5]|uniref:LysM peptidoglycan-binding domain-containing protein n=1 Tax=Okeania sp. SIO3I5 TaxID=2607805 RepID=UPI0013BCC836|nr:LysM domain-containing protein [Okeania sp. SIO3I5]NEQ36971.1 LysM peptidoglycan-binding domain-containing protein [Okeania sp. SIO3I5]
MSNQDLGVLFPGFQTSKSSYLADNEVSEVYNLSVQSPGYIEIQLKDLVADADLYLLSLIGGDTLDSSISYGAYQEESIRHYLEPGNYLISVRNVNNVFNSDSFFDPNVFRRDTNYTLDISFDIENSSNNTTADSSGIQGLVTSPSIEYTTPNFSDTQGAGLGGYIGARPVEDTTPNFSNSQGAGLGGYIGVVPSNQEQSTNSRLVVEESVDGSEWNASFFLFDGLQPPTDFYQNEANKFAVLNLGPGGNSFSADWGLYSPRPQVPADNFAIRSYTHADFEPGKEYEFTVRADDGYQLLAKHHITNQWVYITPQETWEQDYGGNTFTYRWPDSAPGGKYDLHFHYYEETGNAYFELSWAEKDDWVLYRVSENETLSEIAWKTTGDVSNTSIIAEHNGIVDPNFIYENQIIEVPKGNYPYNTSSELPITLPESPYVDNGGEYGPTAVIQVNGGPVLNSDDNSIPSNSSSPEPGLLERGLNGVVNGGTDVLIGNIPFTSTLCGLGNLRDGAFQNTPQYDDSVRQQIEEACDQHDEDLNATGKGFGEIWDPGVSQAHWDLANNLPAEGGTAIMKVGFGVLGARAGVTEFANGINDLGNDITENAINGGGIRNIIPFP